MAKKLNYKLEPRLTENNSPLAVNNSPLAEENNPLQGVGTERLQQGQDSQSEVKGTPEPSGYDRILQAMYPAESAEERARREKRQARERLFAGIGDAVSAISNMYAATQGVPSTYNPQTTMSASVQRRHDRINAERDKDRLAWNNAALSRDRLDLNRQREERMRQQANAMAMKNEWQRDYNMGMLDVKRAQVENQKAYNEGMISHRDFQDTMAWLNALSRWQKNQGSTKVTTRSGGTTIETVTPNEYIGRPSAQSDKVVYITEGSQQNPPAGQSAGQSAGRSARSANGTNSRARSNSGNSGRSGSARNSGNSSNGTTKKERPY